MAKRRKHSTKRRRVSGIDKGGMKSLGLAVLFAIAGRKISSMLGKSSNTMLASAAPYAELGLGIILPMFIKNNMVKQGSVGLVVDGAIQAIAKLAPGIISGPYRLPVVSGGVYSPNMVAGRLNGYSPNRSSVMKDALKVVSGIGSGALL